MDTGKQQGKGKGKKQGKKINQGKQGPQIPKQIPNREHYSRISYLIQASNYFNSDPKYAVLSRSLTRNADLVSKKTVSKLTPSLKRSICKKCSTWLVHGLTQSIRIENTSRAKSTKSDILVYTCNTCDTEKRFPVGKDREYKLFSEKEGVVFDVS